MGIEHFYQGTPGTPPSQTPLEAFKGGYFGGLAYTPLTVFRNKVQTTTNQEGQPIHVFDGKEYATEVEAAQAAMAKAADEIENTLKPGGINFLEEAEDFLRQIFQPLGERSGSADLQMLPAGFF